ncbi:MAG TPA: AAA domain-containing protein [Pyrinomonadaceae bacterium]|nr:AAA domain-containing protein [Pyrinomonadaceae bacterium]
MAPTPEPPSPFDTERPLTAQRLAQYVARGRCERHLRFALFKSEAQALMRRYGLEAEPLSPLLSGAGQRFEEERVAELAEGAEVRDLRGQTCGQFVGAVKSQGAGRVFYYQPTLVGRIGGWACEGRADLIEVVREGARVEATVVDFKASARESVGFRLQVAFYARLLAGALAAAGFERFEVRGAVAARDSRQTSEGGWETFDLALYLDEIEALVAAPDSDVARAARAARGTARYHLRASCDGCPYNALCFADTAEREDLSLVPLLTPSEKRALEAEGVTTARALAALMRYGAGAMEAAPGAEEEARRVSARWPLAGRLPVLVQRARAAVNRFDKSVTSRRYLVGADYGSLPDEAQHPGLVRVFVDAQRDYLKDRLFLVAARVAGPRGAFEIVEMTGAPPDADTERAMLLAWVQGLLPAIADAADAARAPLHFYTFAPRGERALLDALARHFDALCAVPAFYDLLTSHPALTQPMVSLLSEEVRARLNLAPVCHNLYEVARALGFEWRDRGTDFRQTFRARVFDNRRAFERDPATGQFKTEGKGVKGEEAKRDDDKHAASHQVDDERPAASHRQLDERHGASHSPSSPLDLFPSSPFLEEEAPPPFVYVESTARFGAEIPLEYAYAAWGALVEPKEATAGERAQAKGFLGVSGEQLRAFAAHRTRAMQHVEESFAYKNRRVEKEPLDLARLHEVSVAPEEVPLHRSLEDFLLLEHHASFQERLLHLSQPPRERAATGRALILRCESYDKDEEKVERASLGFADAEGRAQTVKDLGLLRLRAGDWTVLNPLADAEGRALPAWRVVRGRLAVVEELTDAGLSLRLMPMSFKNSPFRYPHGLFAPAPGTLYTLDEMADDLNSDKFLEACRHAPTNHLYRWLSDPEEGRRPRALRPKRLRDALEVAALAARSQQPHGLTRAQTNVVGSHLEDRVLVVQGPPGTGKSHTLGFAVLARALAQSTPARPFRVAVLARTHAATGVALSSIARRTRELLDEDEKHGGSRQSSTLQLAPLARLRVVKVCNDAGDAVPEGVGRVLPGGDEEASAAEQWEQLLGEELLVVGGTPGGLYRLVRAGAAKGRRVNWAEKFFDLVVVDEASQMGLAEALTAGAFLRDDGQFIAVGDHRQMPPILAHAWDREARRDIRRARPHLSIFEYLLEAGFARAALDESFRIPAEVADFLGRHVYAADGIDFRSSNRTRLAAAADIREDWLRAALAPEHALVVVEHDESGSQQSNEFEAALVEAIARAASERLNLDARRGLGVVVPHRAQKALLAARLPALADSIDTVERFQGGERDLIVVSATVSDREFAAGESGFLLEPRRLTVAVSRPRRKLIVVASRAVFDLIPADLDDYERGALWKHLRREASARTLWQGEVNGHRVTVRAIHMA